MSKKESFVGLMAGLSATVLLTASAVSIAQTEPLKQQITDGVTTYYSPALSSPDYYHMIVRDSQWQVIRDPNTGELTEVLIAGSVSASVPTESEYRQTFDRMDSNHDGALSMKERSTGHLDDAVMKRLSFDRELGKTEGGHLTGF